VRLILLRLTCSARVFVESASALGITFYKLGGQPNDIQSLKTLAFQIVPVFGYMTQGASDLYLFEFRIMLTRVLFSGLVCPGSAHASFSILILHRIYKWCTTLIVFDREREDNLYSPVSWLAGEFLAWLPVNIISPLIYSIMIYLICNLRRDDLGSNLGIFIGDMILVQLCFVAWALFAASIEVSLPAMKRFTLLNFRKSGALPAPLSLAMRFQSSLSYLP
jgi:ABC-type multidrug transport system permease subunit